MLFDKLAMALNSENNEVLIVDNNSTDSTMEIARAEKRFLVRMFECKKQGQAYARKVGVQEAKGEFVLFVDDDNMLASDYLYQIENAFDQHPSAYAVGGRSEAIFDPGFDPPLWFEDYKFGYACGSQKVKSGYIEKNDSLLFGAGLSVRRKKLLQIYENGFSPVLGGRVGRLLMSGDDSELCVLLLIAGGGLYYCDSATLEHYMPEDRINEKYLRKLFYGFGYSKPFLSYYLSHTKNGKRFRRSMGVNVLSCWISSVLKALSKRDVVSLCELKGCLRGGYAVLFKRPELAHNINCANNFTY